VEKRFTQPLIEGRGNIGEVAEPPTRIVSGVLSLPRQTINTKPHAEQEERKLNAVSPKPQ
jgi:hypothetical protein